ncbi:MAG TPA: hypothetical protein VG722_10065 [Tepidisphaeraceae bacterium]|nr:hypothetical protein [Tepidisphaeraceae bacterium]
MILRIFLAALFVGSAASAAVIYEPVQYQYNDGHRVFYYGGTNPRIIEHGFVNAWLARGTPLPPAVYIDALPLRNAANFGYTPDNAHNAARFFIPRYFEKKNLIPTNLPPSLDGQCGCRQ